MALRAAPCHVLFVAALLAATMVHVAAALDIGVFISLTGNYASDMRQAHDGLVFWRDYVNSRWGGVPLSNGTVIPINLIIRDDQSSLAVAATIWQSFVSMGLAVVIGGHTSMTVAASTYFEQFGVINIACCTGPDEVYTANPRSWILGIHRSSADYPKGFLNQLHVRDKNRVAIVYNDASSFSITTADSAESFGKSIGMEVISKTSYSGAGYTNLNGTGGQQLAAQIAALERFSNNNTDFALFAISLGPDGQDVARVVAQRRMQLNALFITVAPTSDTFIATVGPATAEYIFSPLQWHNSMKFTDPILNSSLDYSRLFLREQGYAATYLAASGTAAGVVLHLGLQSAMTTEKYALMQALRELRADTFFGPVAFNRYQRNYGGSTATIEIVDSASHAVLPDESAQILVVLPPRRIDLAQCPDPAYTNFTKCFEGLKNAGSGDGSNTPVTVGVVVGVLVPLLTLLAVAAYQLRARQVLAARPLDATKPFAVMFVGIKNLSELSDLGQDVASSVCQRVGGVVRKAARAHSCFEARRIDESTVMITSKRSEDALACASAILEQCVKKLRWGFITLPEEGENEREAAIERKRHIRRQSSDTRLSQCQGTDEMSGDERPSHHVRSLAKESTSSATHRRKSTQPHLQIGVHFGLGSIDFDEENNTVSYHGAAVDRAAIVTDAAVGNQILVSRELITAMDEVGDADQAMSSVGHFAMPESADAARKELGVMFVPLWMTDAFVASIEDAAKEHQSTGERTSGQISAALQQAEAGLSMRRIAVVCVEVPWLAEAHDAKDLQRIAQLCDDLEDIAAQHRGEVYSTGDSTLIFTLNAGTATRLPIVRAASIAIECVRYCGDLHFAASAGIAMSVCVVGRQQGRVTAFGTAVHTAHAAQKAAKAASVPVVLAENGYEDVASRFHVMTLGLMLLPSGQPGRVVAVMDARDSKLDGEWIYTVGEGSAGLAANEEAWHLVLEGRTPPPGLVNSITEVNENETSGWHPALYAASRIRIEQLVAACTVDEAVSEPALLKALSA